MGDRAFERTIIRDTPERIFEVIIDYAAYPKWANNVKDVVVDRIDEDGRAGLVSYRAAAMGRSAAYVLEYFYGTNPLRVSWRLAEGDLVRRLDGRYVLVPLEDDATGHSPASVMSSSSPPVDCDCASDLESSKGSC